MSEVQPQSTNHLRRWASIGALCVMTSGLTTNFLLHSDVFDKPQTQHPDAKTTFYARVSGHEVLGKKGAEVESLNIDSCAWKDGKEPQLVTSETEAKSILDWTDGSKPYYVLTKDETSLNCDNSVQLATENVSLSEIATGTVIRVVYSRSTDLMLDKIVE
jgi:hypothetical protein